MAKRKGNVFKKPIALIGIFAVISYFIFIILAVVYKKQKPSWVYFFALPLFVIMLIGVLFALRDKIRCPTCKKWFTMEVESRIKLSENSEEIVYKCVHCGRKWREKNTDSFAIE